jgi:hypothetical protein
MSLHFFKASLLARSSNYGVFASRRVYQALRLGQRTDALVRYESHDAITSPQVLSHADLRARADEILETKYPKYRTMGWSGCLKIRSVLEAWIKAGEPPISEYRLTFGKHRGKQLDEVPDAYIVKYLIPRHLPREGDASTECPFVGDAVADFMKRHPDVQSQAGRSKTKPLKEGTLKQPEAKKRGRPAKANAGNGGS